MFWEELMGMVGSLNADFGCRLGLEEVLQRDGRQNFWIWMN